MQPAGAGRKEAFLRELLDKLWSRKLAAFIAATVALWFGIVDQATWQGVAIAYLGAQGLVDLAEAGLDFAKARTADKPLDIAEALNHGEIPK